MNPLTKDILSFAWPVLIVIGTYILATREKSDKNTVDTSVLRRELDGILKEFKEFATANQSVILNHTIMLGLMTKTLDSTVTKIEGLDRRIGAIDVEIAVINQKNKEKE